MKNKKFLKSAALALGTVASVAAPIAAVVSCGSESDFSHKVVIKTTWAASGDQINALKESVAAYNKQKGADDYEVVVKHVEGGYGTAFTNDEKDIKIGHMSSVADAYIDYPDTVGKLSSIRGKDYSLDLSTAGVDLNTFDSRFTANTKSLPLALSSEMTTIDLPVLGMMLDAVADDDSKTITGGVIEEALAAWNKSDSDKVAIKKIWGKKAATITKIAVTENTFMDYSELFKFAKVAQDAFVSPDGKTAAATDHHVVGDDSPANLAYIMYASENAGTDGSGKDIYSTTKNLFMENNTPEKTKFKTTLTKIHDAVESGSVILNGGGAYSSSDLTYHRMAFAIGSTAGYSHNFIKVGGDKTTLNIGSATTKIEKELGHYDKTLKLNDAKTDLVTNDKYENQIVATGTKPYSVVVDQAKLDLLLAAAKKPKAKVYQVESLPANIADAIKADAKAADIAFSKAKSYDSKGAPHDTNIIVLPEDKVTQLTDNGADTLNRNETEFIPAPNTDGTGSKFAMSQGPSFVGVKHGGQKDIELGKFLKWFYDPSSRLQGKDSASTASVVDSFAKAASYVTPKKDFTSVKWDEEKFGGNLMVTKVFADTNVKAYTNPVTKDSKAIRDQIETSLKDTLQTQIHQGHDISVEKIYTDIVSKLKLDDVK